MDNISIVIQDEQNPITTQSYTELNSIDESQPIFIHKTYPDGSVEIIDLITWQNHQKKKLSKILRNVIY